MEHLNGLTKDKTIFELLEKLKLQTGFEKVEIIDHWDGDLCAIGLKNGGRMVYVNTYNYSEGRTDGYDYDLEILNEQEPTNLNVIKEGRFVTEDVLITEIKTFLEI
jgi:hypothetical protein